MAESNDDDPKLAKARLAQSGPDVYSVFPMRGRVESGTYKETWACCLSLKPPKPVKTGKRKC